jgi:hypothetical protein
MPSWSRLSTTDTRSPDIRNLIARNAVKAITTPSKKTIPIHPAILHGPLGMDV